MEKLEENAIGIILIPGVLNVMEPGISQKLAIKPAVFCGVVHEMK